MTIIFIVITILLILLTILLILLDDPRFLMLLVHFLYFFLVLFLGIPFITRSVLFLFIIKSLTRDMFYVVRP